MSHVLRCLSKLYDLSFYTRFLMPERICSMKSVLSVIVVIVAFRNGAKGSLKCKISLMHGSRFVILLIGTVLYQNMGTTDDYLYLLTT